MITNTLLTANKEINKIQAESVNKENRKKYHGWYKSSITNNNNKKNLCQVTSCLEKEDWQMKEINRPALSHNRRHTRLPPCFFFFFTLLPFYFAGLLLLYKPLCFDSALYLYFKWLNYTGSRGENYGCFPLFLSTGTLWPLPGSNNPPSSLSFLHPSLLASLSLHLSYLPPLPQSPIFLDKRLAVAVWICDWEEIIAKWSCLWALCTASRQRMFLQVIFLLSLYTTRPPNRVS